MTEQKSWEPSDADAFVLSTRGGHIKYYFAIKAALHDQGNHYYKESEDGEFKEVEESEILYIIKQQGHLDILKQQKAEGIYLDPIPEDVIFQKCPCTKVSKDGEHLVPLIQKVDRS